jgi:hypothetical protein
MSIETTEKDARAEVGDIVMILGFSGSQYKSEKELIGKTGKVTFIDSTGAIHGTWGGISLLPDDDYVVCFGENDGQG